MPDQKKVLCILHPVAMDKIVVASAAEVQFGPIFKQKFQTQNLTQVQFRPIESEPFPNKVMVHSNFPFWTRN